VRMSQPRALIVDDDEPIRTMLAALVQQSGFAVDTAADGAEAIASIDRDGYNVLLLDIMMPRVNGYDVLRHLEAKRPDLLRCTIVATALPERELTDNLKQAVFKVHRKPFDVPRLLADVRTCSSQ
jgi:DNA-binding response OmpR family regulator